MGTSFFFPLFLCLPREILFHLGYSRAGGNLSSLFHLNTISLTTNTHRNYFLKKEGFYKPFVVLVLRCREIEKD